MAAPLKIDMDWMQHVLLQLLRTSSPSGRTDQIMYFLGEVLAELGIEFELTRRGSLVAAVHGEQNSPDRSVIVHADTIGMMVKELKANGRLAVVPIGNHSARCSEGARVTIFTEDADVCYSGTVLPLKASGHRWGDEVDTQGVGWDHVEVRVDEPASSVQELADLGIRVGDFVAHYTLPEITSSGYVKSRHLDDKAGIAATLAAFKALGDERVELPVTAHLLVTITEEVGHGASTGWHGDVAEMVSVDSAVVAPNQTSREDAITVAMQDMHGPFDFHLTRKLARLCESHGIPHERDVFANYRSDIAAALEAGAETRAALLGFGVDATHSHERTHLRSLRHVAELLTVYLQTDLTFGQWDVRGTGPLEEFPAEDQPAPTQPGFQLPESPEEATEAAQP